jgi:hypothetical protein
MPHTGPEGQKSSEGCGHVTAGLDGQIACDGQMTEGQVTSGLDGHNVVIDGQSVMTDGQVNIGRDGGHWNGCEKQTVTTDGQLKNGLDGPPHRAIGRDTDGQARFTAAAASTHPNP